MEKAKYEHGDIILVENPQGDKPFPCVVIRNTTIGMDEKTGFVVALRTNNPAFIRSYEPDVSMELFIGEKKKGFITTSPIFVKESEIKQSIGRLTDSQMAEFDEMLLKCVGIKTTECPYKEMYYQLKADIAGLIL